MDLLDAKAVGLRFRERLLLVMGRYRMSVPQFAEACGVSRFTVSNWVSKGQIPNGYSLYLICESFGVSANWLLGMEERR